MTDDVVPQCSAAFVVRWTPNEGFKTEPLIDGQPIGEGDKSRVIGNVVPSGSRWSKYRRFRTVRIYQESIAGRPYFVLSVSRITSEDYPHAGVKTVPTTWIYLLTCEEMDEFHKKGREWFLRFLLGEGGDSPQSEPHAGRQLPDVTGQRYFTLINKSNAEESCAWRHLEVFFLDEFYQAWPGRVLSLATLCTPEDRVDAFKLVGMRESDIGKFERGKFSTLTVGPGEEITVQFKSLATHMVALLHAGLTHELHIALFTLLLLLILSFASGYVTATMVTSRRTDVAPPTPRVDPKEQDSNKSGQAGRSDHRYGSWASAIIKELDTFKMPDRHGFWGYIQTSPRAF